MPTDLPSQAESPAADVDASALPKIDSPEIEEISARVDGASNENMRKKQRIVLLEKYMWVFATYILWSVWAFGKANLFDLNIPLIGSVRGDTFFNLAIAISAFPFVYYQIFEMLPFEAGRSRAWEKRMMTKYGPLRTSVPVPQAIASTAGANEDKSSDELLSIYAVSSTRIAEGIYRRAGVYLLVGVVIAFLGVGFFYADPPNLSAADARAPAMELAASAARSTIPRLGVLIFVEIVAFYFLKLYRAAMDEFRYFESIKRRREEMLILEKIGLASGCIPADVLDLVKTRVFFSSAGVLHKDETSELLEARKLEKGELEILDKVVAAISSVRKT